MTKGVNFQPAEGGQFSTGVDITRYRVRRRRPAYEKGQSRTSTPGTGPRALRLARRSLGPLLRGER